MSFDDNHGSWIVEMDAWQDHSVGPEVRFERTAPKRKARLHRLPSTDEVFRRAVAEALQVLTMKAAEAEGRRSAQLREALEAIAGPLGELDSGREEPVRFSADELRAISLAAGSSED